MASKTKKYQTKPFFLPTQTKYNHLYHPPTKPLAPSRRWLLSSGKIPPVLSREEELYSRIPGFPAWFGGNIVTVPVCPRSQISEMRLLFPALSILLNWRLAMADRKSTRLNSSH